MILQYHLKLMICTSTWIYLQSISRTVPLTSIAIWKANHQNPTALVE
ncbi:hypothetical protein NC653_033659 [Populus alba x Populus x berolinensis]|uniref:Uncharacterized protein n=1 Tax=Populus alba x Populus x berolinensis TaxID=444605 RepID=A0AAD6LVG7_9ROSI|nr:hypothetical protein NC653_033659 [Populus alba x Populus x berolinensis]